MIQRIQSIYLFLAAILMAVSIFVPLVMFDIDENTLTLVSKGILEGDILVKPTWGILVFSTLASLIPFISIFLFKNRNKQMRIIQLAILLGVLLYITIFVYLFSYSPDLLDNSLAVYPSLFLPFLAIIFEVIAFFKVKKDEKLVKSLDRIR